MSAVGAVDAGEALAQVATLEELADRLAYDGTQEAIPLLKPLGVDPLELVEVVGEDPVDGRLLRMPWTIEFGL
jgi:hypothetical protein